MRNDPRIRAILDSVAADCASRPHFSPALSREAAEQAIDAILWAHGSRPTDAAAIYAYDALYRALGIDWAKSTIVFLPDGSDSGDSGGSEPG